MTRIKRLEPVVRHTDKKQQQALLAMASSQAELDQENSKLVQLQAYRSEYLEKELDTNSTCSSLELQELKRFLAQLDQTIEQQQAVIKIRERDLGARRRSWQSTRIDSKKLHKVVENLQQQENIQAVRKEQKALDEFSQIRYRKN